MDRDNEALRRRMTGTAGDPAESEESAEDETYVVREGVTRAIDPDELSTVRNDRDLTQEETHARAETMGGGFNPDAELARPSDLPESVDVPTVAPDGTAMPDRTSQLTDPLTGEAIGGGRSVSDSVKAAVADQGVDLPDRGLDYDPLTPGIQDSRPGGQETTGDPSVDRAISEHDGSLVSADKEPKKWVDPPSPPAKSWTDRMWEKVTGGGGTPDAGTGGGGTPVRNPTAKVEPKPAWTENPDADSGDSVTNLERVTVMQGSQVQPSNNPDDPATGVSTENYIPPEDLVTMPAQDGETAATTLTSAATLGTSPVSNPTDPVLGDDGIIAGGTYGGSGGSGGGGEIMPTGMSAGDASALGGEGEANLPIGGGGEASALGGEGEANLPIGGGGEASALGGAGDANLPTEPAPAGALFGQKHDINNVSVDMATGQVVGSAALADDAASAIGAADATLGGESLGAPGGLEGPPPIGEESPPPDGDDG